MSNGLRALLFDDDNLVRAVVKQICKRRGYEVVEFSNANHFCSMLDGPCPCTDGQRCADIIVSDIKMPGVTGVELLERLLRRKCAIPHMALMSGYWTPETLSIATQEGFRIFRKPVGIWEIDSWLMECELNIHPAGRELVDSYGKKEPEIAQYAR